MDGSRASPFRGGLGGRGLASPGLAGGRLRSASPSRRALAIDMRRIASLLRDPAGALGERNNSICSSPNSAWEPGDRGAAPVTGNGNGNGNGSRAVSLSRTVMQNQFTALAERINAGVTMLQRQCETDRRRLGQLEKKFEAKVSDADKHDGRERWAEVQGSVSGLLEETQALARRLDGLDERLWARTSGSEASKQRNRELEQQVQALEQQNRLAAAAAEELQKRQATKIRRTEHSLEEVLRRMATLEDEVRQRSGSHRDGYLEAKFITLEQNQETLDAELRALQANLEDGLQQLRDEFTPGGQEGTELHSNDVFEAVRKADTGLSSLERKVTSQVEDVSSTVASLRVKVDGVLSRVSGLAERIETAHEPSIDSLRLELSQARAQERREVDAEVQALKHRLQQVQDSNDEACSEVAEALRQARAETAALSCRSDIPEDNSWMRSTEERLAGYEQDLFDVREQLEAITQGELDGKTVAIKPNEEVEDMRRRLDWLEEQGPSADKPEVGRLAQVQNSICDLVEQVSKLKQQANSAEANSSSWQQQVKQIHSLIERKQNEDAASLRVTSEVEAKVGALSSQVADLAARLLEVEGNLDFVRENEPSSLTEAPTRMTMAALSGEVPSQPSALQEKLEAVAAHLEVVDDLTERVGDLERRTAGPEFHRGNQSPGPLSEVSFGGEAPVKAAQAESMGRELGDLQLRMDANDGKLKSLSEEVRTKLALAKAEGQGAQTQLNDLAARMGSFEQILSTMQEAPAASFADLDALRLEFADKFDKVPDQDEEVQREAQTSKIAMEMKEVKQEVEELSDKVDLTLDDLKEGLVATKNTVEAAMAPIKQELKDLRMRLPDADAEASAEQAILEKLEEVDTKIKGFQKELQVSKSVPQSDDLAEVQSAIKRLQESSASDEVSARMKQMEEELQRIVKEEIVSVREELKKELSSIENLEEKVKAASAKGDKDQECLELREMVDELRKSSEVELLECREQMKQLEQKMAEGGPGECAEDLKLRSQVQQQVSDLGLQLSKEVANLAEHQRDMLETHKSLEELTEQFDGKLSKETTELRGELQSLVNRLCSTESLAKTAQEELKVVDVKGLLERVTSNESKSLEMKKDLEELLGPKNKIGISSSAPQSPLDEVRGRLDILSEQVAELQSKQESFGAGPNITVVHSGRDHAASADGSLNFSLTEQTERPGGNGDGSLNFSLTETAKEPPTALERRAPNLYINAEADSDADADILSASDSPASAAGKMAQAGFADEIAEEVSNPDSPNSEKKDASSSQVSASFNEMSIMADYSVELSTELDEKCDFVEAVRPMPAARRGMAVSSPIQEAEEEAETVAAAPAVSAAPGGVPNLPAAGLQAKPGSDALDAFLKPKATLAPLVSGPRGDALDSLLAPKTTLLPRKLEALDPVVGHKEMPKMEKEKEEKKDAKMEEKNGEKTEEKKDEKTEKEQPEAKEDKDKEEEEDYDDNSFDDNMSVPSEESIQEESDLGGGSPSHDDSV